MAEIAGIARDIAFVIVCLVLAASALLILSSVRNTIRRLNEAMDRVDNLLDSVVAARDAISDIRERVRNRAGMGSKGSDSGFNVVTWLLSPLGFVINRQFRGRSRDNGDKDG